MYNRSEGDGGENMNPVSRAAGSHHLIWVQDGLVPMAKTAPAAAGMKGTALCGAAYTAGLLKEDRPVRIYENHEITAAAVQHTGNNAG
jgi:hypothetical protein